MKTVKLTVLVEVDDSCPDPRETALNLIDELAESANKGGDDPYVLGVAVDSDTEVS